jgi:hypothetical protein
MTAWETLVQDCEVCCQPWQVRVGYDDGVRYVEVRRGHLVR